MPNPYAPPAATKGPPMLVDTTPVPPSPHELINFETVRMMLDDLFSQEKTSDLTINCPGKTFHVHRNVVSLRSFVLKVVCTGPFLESQTRIINTHHDHHAIQRMIEFMYTGDYSNAEFKALATEDTATFDECPRFDLSYLLRPAIHGKLLDCEDSALVLHARVYALGEYYDAPELKFLALGKFKESLLPLLSPNFMAVVREVYSSTPAHNRGLCDVILSHLLSQRHVNILDLTATTDVIDDFKTDLIHALFQNRGSEKSRLRQEIKTVKKEARRDVRAARSETEAAMEDIDAAITEYSGLRRDYGELLAEHNTLKLRYNEAIENIERAEQQLYVCDDGCVQCGKEFGVQLNLVYRHRGGQGPPALEVRCKCGKINPTDQ